MDVGGEVHWGIVSKTVTQHLEWSKSESKSHTSTDVWGEKWKPHKMIIDLPYIFLCFSLLRVGVNSFSELTSENKEKVKQQSSTH